MAVGYDDGTILVKMGRDEPAVTMDVNGKLIWARHSELCQGNLMIIAVQFFSLSSCLYSYISVISKMIRPFLSALIFENPQAVLNNLRTPSTIGDPKFEQKCRHFFQTYPLDIQKIICSLFDI